MDDTTQRTMTEALLHNNILKNMLPQMPVLKTVEPAGSKGSFLNGYSLTYENPADSTLKTYEIVSRDAKLTSESLSSPRPASVILLAFDVSKSNILLSCEYRMSLQQTAIGLPSGLIDTDETPEQTAARELKEETGLHVIDILNVLPVSALLPGITNDLTYLVILTAEGKLTPCADFPEYGVPFWADKNMALTLLKEDAPLLTSHAQVALAMWTFGGNWHGKT